MKLFIKEIALWLSNGKCKIISTFQKNKINVICGDPRTGKTAIMAIIDYCLLSSDNPIPQGEEYLEQIEWCGVLFEIDNTNILISRNTKDPKEIFSQSGIAQIDTNFLPKRNANIDDLKGILQEKFGLSYSTIQGGKTIRQGSKNSFRFFLLPFSVMPIESFGSEILFYKQADQHYQEALTRNLDIAIGSTSLEQKMLEERIKARDKELKKIKETSEKIKSNAKSILDIKEEEYIQRAKELFLLNENASSINNLITIISDQDYQLYDTSGDLDQIKKNIFSLKIKLAKYKKYRNSHNKYKNMLENCCDSLNAFNFFLEFLKYNQEDEIISNLKEQTQKIQIFIKDSKTPIAYAIDNTITELEQQIKTLCKKRDSFLLPKDLTNLREKQLMFIGEIRALHNASIKLDTHNQKIQDLEYELKELRQLFHPFDNNKAIEKINNIMYSFYDTRIFKGYTQHRPFFHISTKNVALEKNGEIQNEIGSSSLNSLLHLMFFLSLHIHAIGEPQQKHLAQLLILDQPSHAFYSGDNNDDGSVFTRYLLNMLEKFIDCFLEKNEDFQIILLDHLKWEQDIAPLSLKHFHLIDEWFNGVGLIPN